MNLHILYLQFQLIDFIHFDLDNLCYTELSLKLSKW